jgi:hypothetical protein
LPMMSRATLEYMACSAAGRGGFRAGGRRSRAAL